MSVREPRESGTAKTGESDSFAQTGTLTSGRGMLLIWGRGFFGYELARRVVRSGAHLLARAPAGLALPAAPPGGRLLPGDVVPVGPGQQLPLLDGLRATTRARIPRRAGFARLRGGAGVPG